MFFSFFLFCLIFTLHKFLNFEFSMEVEEIFHHHSSGIQSIRSKLNEELKKFEVSLFYVHLPKECVVRFTQV
jgi:hypothetical protein